MDVKFQEKETKKQSFNIKCFNNHNVCVDFVASDFTLFKGFLRNIFNFFLFLANEIMEWLWRCTG